MKLISKTLFDGKGKLDIDGMQVNAEKIILFGKTWGEKDPMCCPSVEATVNFYLHSGRLIELGFHDLFLRTLSMPAN